MSQLVVGYSSSFVGRDSGGMNFGKFIFGQIYSFSLIFH